MWSGGVVKDQTMIRYAKAVSDVKVNKVVSELSLEEQHLVSILIGLGVLDLTH